MTTPASSSPSPRTLRAIYGLRSPAHLRPGRTALVLVDFQEEFRSGLLPLPAGEEARARAAELLAWARREGVLAVHVRNVTRPGAPLFAPDRSTSAFTLAPGPGEPVVTKATGGAFTATGLDGTLRARGVDTIVVAGLMTHLAVAITAQDAAVLGYAVIVASDACATRDLPGVGHADLHRSTLAAIADRFAEVKTAGDVLALPLAAG